MFHLSHGRAASARVVALFAALSLLPPLGVVPALAGNAGDPSQTSFLPDDVVSAIGSLSPEQRQQFCVVRPVELTSAQAITPVERIAGFTSRMKNDQDQQDPVPGAAQSERFARLFGNLAANALVTGDVENKRALVSLLAKWAKAGAFLKTKSCVRPNGDLITSGECGEWRKPDGSDLSAMKDATFATFLAVGLIRAYYLALADVDGVPEEQAAIQKWIEQVGHRLKRPTQVYFGLNMGWYWPAITADLGAGRIGNARSKLAVLQKGLIKLIHDDGSIQDRTSRGDRALWYHHTSLDEIIVSMEMMRAVGVPISPVLEKKLHAAVALFIGAINDPHVLDKWAVERHHARFSGTQDWDWQNWPNTDFAGSWFHIYAYRYPDTEQGAALRRLVPVTSLSADRDIDFGIGIGCVYNAAASARS